MARSRQKQCIYGAVIQTAILACVFALSLVPIGERMLLFEYVDANFHDQLFRLRNGSEKKRPISDDIVLVGIDDNTQLKLGTYGKGQWVARIPFIEQIAYFHRFRPKVLAYDLLFLDTRTREQALQELSGDEEELISAESEERIKEFLRIYRKEGGFQDPGEYLDTLRLLSRLTGRVSDSALGKQLSDLFNEEMPLILAYHIPVERHNQGRKWDVSDILGTDPDDLSEDNGTTLPYLYDMAIPADCVSGIPDDYAFNDFRAKLPGDSLLDFCQLGYINVPRDRDGVVRRLPMVYGLSYEFSDPETGEQVKRRFFVPSMSLLACLNWWGVGNLAELKSAAGFTPEEFPVKIRFGDAIEIQIPDGRKVRVPIDDQGYYYINFVADALDFRNLSFASVGNYSEVRDHLAGRIVFVGATMTGATDVGPTPLAQNSPLVIAHMNAVSNILTGTYIRPLRGVGLLLVFGVLWLIFVPLGAWLRPWLFSLVVLAGLAAHCAVVYAAIHFHAFVVPLTGPLAAMVMGYIGVLVMHYFSEEKEKQAIRGMFSTMVSADVLTYMEENPGTFSLAGEEREATVFFSDVAGFTSISEALEPQALVKLLNAYLTPMTEIIMDSQGYVDKYEGDAIMAEWGVPFANPDHAKLACHAALDQQAKLAEIRDHLEQKFGHRLYVRMGVNSGIVSAGGMGSARKLDYTVMGDTVNQAARFEPANKDYGTRIIIGEPTYELAQDHIEVRLLDLVQVTGKQVPVKIYELLARKGELPERKQKAVKLYEKALELHWKWKFELAIEVLREALQVEPSDSPTRMLLVRITRYLEKPPKRNWQGEFIRSRKD